MPVNTLLKWVVGNRAVQMELQARSNEQPAVAAQRACEALLQQKEMELVLRANGLYGLESCMAQLTADVAEQQLRHTVYLGTRLWKFLKVVYKGGLYGVPTDGGFVPVHKIEGGTMYFPARRRWWAAAWAGDSGFGIARLLISVASIRLCRRLTRRRCG